MILINITSYNREKKLINLVEQLEGVDIKVWDDCSDFKIEYSYKWDNKTTFYRFSENYGLRNCWRKFKRIFEELQETDYKYFIFLPDDVIVCDDFVNIVVEIWESIEDEEKISLSFSSVKRCEKPNWTGYEAHKVGNVIKTQWNDLMFICEKRFFQEVDIEEVSKERWNNKLNLGSGVGSQISNKLNNKGFSMYNISEDLVKHIGNNDSKMNPKQRKKTKL